ncbi:MAG: sigma-70 family RNA polymerase sigma factor [Verrucomicrobia bacterium]|nr:sigma-70 family RNA polymerase sigma factor [Verrucomicrobiota bacterium]
MQPTEGAIPESCRPAEAAAAPDFAQIYEEHGRQVYYVALRMLSDPTQAEDATHDVFVKVFRNLDRFRGESCIRTWLYRITMNHCQNMLKSWQHRHIHPSSDDALWEVQEGPDESPLEVLETTELGARIQKTLDALPLEYRKLLLLVADEELSYEKIAQITEQSTDAVRGKLHRARKAFAQAFRTTA